jgi:surface antigen
MGAIDAYQHVAEDSQQSTIRRLNAACTGADLAARSQATGPAMTLYALALELLDEAAWRGMHRRDQERLLADYGRLPSDAAAMAITAGRPQIAVEFLERGRGVLLDRLVDDSADLALLSEADPGLTGRFEEIRHALENIPLPDVDADVIDLPVRPAHHRSEADERSALACQFDRLLAQVRATPGCSDLFRPPGFSSLSAAIGQRTVAIVNISAYRCDALCITSAGLMVTPLPDLTRQDAEDAAEFFRDHAVKTQRPGSAGWNARQELTARLAWLWDAVAEPVLRDAGMTSEAPAQGETPRLHWCPTGPAVFLPIHAAGHHTDIRPPAPRSVIDRAESSYIPKLRVLASRHLGRASAQETSQRPLIVSMPATPGRRPLPGAQAEANHLLTLFPGATHLTGPAATRDAVLIALRLHTWVHFALHGVTDIRTPTDGGLELSDGRLTIRDLSEQRLPDARFAFLSACATYQGSPAIPDEAVTFGGALLIAGCENVVATLWPVRDDHATDIMRRLYGHIVAVEEGTDCLYPQGSARALRETARALRDAYPGQPDRWAAFIHTASG